MVYLAVARRQDEGGETALGKGQSYGRAIEDGICGLVRDVKDGAVIIDCSTEGNLHADVLHKAAYLSTHDNHLGQITTALALYNTALCALWQRGLKG